MATVIPNELKAPLGAEHLAVHYQHLAPKGAYIILNRLASINIQPLTGLNTKTLPRIRGRSRVRKCGEPHC